MINWIIIVLVWFTCGFAASGFIFAYFQSEYPRLALYQEVAACARQPWRELENERKVEWAARELRIVKAFLDEADKRHMKSKYKSALEYWDAIHELMAEYAPKQ